MSSTEIRIRSDQFNILSAYIGTKRAEGLVKKGASQVVERVQSRACGSCPETCKVKAIKAGRFTDQTGNTISVEGKVCPADGVLVHIQ